MTRLPDVFDNNREWQAARDAMTAAERHVERVWLRRLAERGDSTAAHELGWEGDEE